MTEEYWPNRNQNLFSDTSDGWIFNACLHFGVDMSHGYTEGYRRAGEVLFKYIDNQDGGFED